jgi:hypothetical protein
MTTLTATKRSTFSLSPIQVGLAFTALAVAAHVYLLASSYGSLREQAVDAAMHGKVTTSDSFMFGAALVSAWPIAAVLPFWAIAILVAKKLRSDHEEDLVVTGFITAVFAVILVMATTGIASGFALDGDKSGSMARNVFHSGAPQTVTLDRSNVMEWDALAPLAEGGCTNLDVGYSIDVTRGVSTRVCRAGRTYTFTRYDPAAVAAQAAAQPAA